MNKFKVTYKEPEISSERIERHKNFDQLMGQYSSVKSKKFKYRRRKVITGGIALLLSVLAIWLVLSRQSSIEDELVQSEKNSAAKTEISQQEPASSSAVLPDHGETEAEEPLKDLAEEQKRELNNEAKPERAEKVPDQQKIGTEKAEPLKEDREEQSEEAIAATFTEAFPTEGMHSLYLYFNESLEYPEEEMMAGIEGTVILSFSINKAGKAENIEVVQPVSAGIDREARRLIEEMPAWTPAFIKGNAVSSAVTLPVTFKTTD